MAGVVFGAGPLEPRTTNATSISVSRGTSSPRSAAITRSAAQRHITAVIGAQFGFEASSFFVDEGNRPRIGQAFIVIDPGALAGSAQYLERIEVLVAEMLKDEGVRLPGARGEALRRKALRRKAELEGIEVAEAVLASLGTIT